MLREPSALGPNSILPENHQPPGYVMSEAVFLVTRSLFRELSTDAIAVKELFYLGIRKFRAEEGIFHMYLRLLPSRLLQT
jgi:hypothetical protein